MSGNGPFQSTKPLPDLTNAFIKLANIDGALRLADWYSPPSRDALAACDLDLGSSGPAVIQESGRVVGVGKSGILYVLNKDAMGRTDAALQNPTAWRGTKDCTAGHGQCFRVAENEYQSPATEQLACNLPPIITISGGKPTLSPSNFQDDDSGYWNQVVDSYPHVHGAPVVWRMGSNNFNLYVWPEQDYLKAYHFNGQQFSTNPVGSSVPITAAMMSMCAGWCTVAFLERDQRKYRHHLERAAESDAGRNSGRHSVRLRLLAISSILCFEIEKVRSGTPITKETETSGSCSRSTRPGNRPPAMFLSLFSPLPISSISYTWIA